MLTSFSAELQKQIYTNYIRNKLEKTTVEDMNFSSFIFKVNHVFIDEDDKLSEKVVIVEEELDGVGKNDIGNRGFS